MKNKVEPIKTSVQIGACDPHDSFSHPAFGVITLSESTGGDPDLFGSDLKHRSYLNITISRATLDRNLCQDNIFGREELIEISLSHAQFAQFITSPGKGGGTPVTIQHFGGQVVPGIKVLETKAQTMEREIRDTCSNQLANLDAMVKQFGDMLQTGKVGLKEARELHRNMQIASSNLPRNMEFVVEQGREAVAEAKNAAMIEVEAYGNSLARRLGVSSIENLVGLEASDPVVLAGQVDQDEVRI